MPRRIKTTTDRERKRAYDRAWYHLHSRQVQARNKQQKRQLHQWYETQKARLVCLQCGEYDPATLVFHHRDAGEKEFSIAQAVHDSWSIVRIVREMDKCDVLCTNCHRRLHYRP